MDNLSFDKNLFHHLCFPISSNIIDVDRTTELATYIHIENMIFSSVDCFKIQDGNKTCNK